jgi:hypothetical protein
VVRDGVGDPINRAVPLARRRHEQAIDHTPY